MAWLTRSSGPGVDRILSLLYAKYVMILCFFINEIGGIRFSASRGLLCGCPLPPQIGSDIDINAVPDAPKGYKIFMAAWDFLGEDWAGAQDGLPMVRGEAGASFHTRAGFAWFEFPHGRKCSGFYQLAQVWGKGKWEYWGLESCQQANIKDGVWLSWENSCLKHIIAQCRAKCLIKGLSMQWLA